MKMGWLRSRRFWFLVMAGIALAIASHVLPWQEWLEAVKQWLPTLGIWAVPAFVLIYVLVTVVGLPNVVLMLVAGTLFGLGMGIVAASIADSLGAVACFLVGRTIARKRVKRWMARHPNFAQLDVAVAEKGWKLLLLTRLSPLVPSNLLNYGFSCTKVNFWQYWFCSWLGTLPVVTLYVYLGAFGMRLIQGDNSPQNLALRGFGLIFTISAAFYTTRWARRAIAQSRPPSEAPEDPTNERQPIKIKVPPDQ
jgi:uncharacterized membrane protein YdjX (TVP38/TMEM64 family)